MRSLATLDTFKRDRFGWRKGLGRPKPSVLHLNCHFLRSRERVHCSAPSVRTVNSHSVLYLLTSKSKSPKGVLVVG